jgi:GH35 family endo-1,4-beta-xylanase
MSSDCPPSPSASWLLQHFADPDSAANAGIDSDIEKYRKGSFELGFQDEKGRPLKDVRVVIEQKRHEFLFGANCFMYEGFPTDVENKRYLSSFLELFNSAVVPFYWADFEPEPGAARFFPDSPRIPRRPPPDSVVAFCREHELVAKGHCLIWHQWLPSWLPKDPAKAGKLIARRIKEITEHYRDSIPLWDVVNEPMEKYLFPKVTMLPDDYIADAFAVAAKQLPPSAQLFLNEATMYSWRKFQEGTTGLKLLLDNLLLRGLKVDGLGLQYHLFFYDKNGLTTTVRDLAEQRDVLLNPIHLRRCLDHFAGSGRPIHISEISLPTYSDLEGSETMQAELLRHLYRLWFSHPSIEGIYWWNLADSGAYGPEAPLKAGLLRSDLSPKPAYETLRHLLKEEWRSSLSQNCAERMAFSAFYGDYDLTANYMGVVHHQSLGLRKNGSRTRTLTLKLAGA